MHEEGGTVKPENVFGKEGGDATDFLQIYCWWEAVKLLHIPRQVGNSRADANTASRLSNIQFKSQERAGDLQCGCFCRALK